MINNLFSYKYVKDLIIVFVFIFGVALFYGNTLQNGFVFDDHAQIEKNRFIQSIDYLPKVMTGCIWESTLGNCRVHYYRPLQSLSYLLTYQISSQPWVFHLVNLIYFTISIFLVYLFVKLLTKNLAISILSAFIFLIHPINSETVNWLATVPELLYTIFTLSATICFFRYRQSKNTHYLMMTYLFYGLGIFSKEPAALMPAIFLCLDFTYFRKKTISFLKWKHLKIYLIYVAILFIYMLLRFWVLNGFGGMDVTYKVTIFQRIYLFFELLSFYIQKVFYPFPLNVYIHSLPSFGFSSLHFLSVVFTCFGYIFLCFLAWKKKWFKVFISLIWFLIFLLPTLIFINTENLTAERFVFASTIGFSILIAVLINYLWQFSPKTKIAATVLIGTFLLISFVTVRERNSIWQNDVRLFTDTLQKSPDADLVRYDLALEYIQKNQIDMAKNELLQIVKNGKWINLDRVYGNLGDIYDKEENYDNALEAYQSALKLKPNNPETYNNIGAMYLKQFKLLQSLPYLCDALQIKPDYQEASFNFNLAGSAIQGLDNKSFMTLYEKVLDGSMFKLVSGNITLKNTDCSYPQGCLLTFSSTLPKDKPPFLFLTVGKTDIGEVVRTRYLKFDPQTAEITLGIDHKFAQENIHFWFPTCNKVYYESLVNE